MQKGLSLLREEVNKLKRFVHFSCFLKRFFRCRKNGMALLMLTNDFVKDISIFVKRSATVKAMREFLDSEGFMEVETPILQTLPGGAIAEPFKTKLNALKMDLYLRVAP